MRLTISMYDIVPDYLNYDAHVIHWWMWRRGYRLSSTNVWVRDQSRWYH